MHHRVTKKRMKKMKLPGDKWADISAYDLEYRSPGDEDAWYSVRGLLDGDIFTVKFLDFPDSSDITFNAGDFLTLLAVDEFTARFRPVSAQVQDDQCSRIVKDMTVCSSFQFKSDDVRFYDAVVESVHHEEHTFRNGEEECTCSFVLCWLHGRNEGNLTKASIANICLIRSDEKFDFRVASFAKMAKEKLKVGTLESVPTSEVEFTSGNGSKDGKCKRARLMLEAPATPGFGEDLCHQGLQKRESTGEFGSAARTEEGWFHKWYERTDRWFHKWYERTDQDLDLGGESFNMNGSDETDSHHFIVVENLETDVSPITIMDFIQKQTSVSPLTYVFPSLLSETYAVVLDCKKKHESVYQFLNNSDYVIVSATGRPWVISEKSFRFGTFRRKFGSLMPESQYPNKLDDGLKIVQTAKHVRDAHKIVHSGTEGYRKAKSLRDIHDDFLEHQRRLHMRLASEERKILESSHHIKIKDELH